MNGGRGRRNVRPRLVLALVALAATALGPVQAASPAAALPVLSVHSGSAGGFTVSGATSRRAGRVVLNFTNSNAHGSDVQLLKLLHGTSMAKVIRDIQAQEGMGAAASTRALTRETHLFGGTGLQAPGQSAQVTETLYSGTYYLLDIAAVFAHKTPTVKALHVYGSPAPRAFPSTAGLISLTSADRFVSPRHLPAGNLLIRNVADTLHFVIFAPVRTGTTDSDITNLFNGTSHDAPFTGPGSRWRC